jgi:hypothetical protein
VIVGHEYQSTVENEHPLNYCVSIVRVVAIGSSIFVIHAVISWDIENASPENMNNISLGINR